MNRYDRQQKTSGGADLDARWSQLRILLIGCGGVGTPLAQSLVRGGIGALTILDGDRVRETDLHRQTLFHEEDARQSVAKATAALKTLEQIGGRTKIEAIPDMLTPSNASGLFSSHDIVLDATDHIPARLLIDRTALTTGVGWIHSGAIADRWVAASFLPPWISLLSLLGTVLTGARFHWNLRIRRSAAGGVSGGSDGSSASVDILAAKLRCLGSPRPHQKDHPWIGGRGRDHRSAASRSPVPSLQ